MRYNEITLLLEDAEGGEENVCKGIQGWLEEERAEGRAEGRAEERVSVLLELVKDGLLDLAEAAKRANKTEEEFEKLLNNL